MDTMGSCHYVTVHVLPDDVTLALHTTHTLIVTSGLSGSPCETIKTEVAPSTYSCLAIRTSMVRWPRQRARHESTAIQIIQGHMAQSWHTTRLYSKAVKTRPQRVPRSRPIQDRTGKTKRRGSQESSGIVERLSCTSVLQPWTQFSLESLYCQLQLSAAALSSPGLAANPLLNAMLARCFWNATLLTWTDKGLNSYLFHSHIRLGCP